MSLKLGSLPYMVMPILNRRAAAVLLQKHRAEISAKDSNGCHKGNSISDIRTGIATKEVSGK